MAKEGLKLTNFYAAQAVCSASRAGLLTGCYPNRIGISGALSPQQNIGINSQKTTLAEMLKAQGYKTKDLWKMASGTPPGISTYESRF